jgi:hypothetical protein
MLSLFPFYKSDEGAGFSRHKKKETASVVSPHLFAVVGLPCGGAPRPVQQDAVAEEGRQVVR